GCARFRGRGRHRSLTSLQSGNGVVLDGGVLCLSTIGRVRVCLHRPLDGTPKTVTNSQQAEGRHLTFSHTEVPRRSLPPSGSPAGMNIRLKVLLVAVAGEGVEAPRRYHRGVKRPAGAQN